MNFIYIQKNEEGDQSFRKNKRKLQIGILEMIVFIK